GALELPTVRSYTTVTAGAGARPLATQYVSGSAIYNPSRHGVDFSGTSARARGGLTGRVFLDANANGTFDRGEEPLAGVRVIVGQVFATSDSSGTYHAWDVLPYEPSMVTVDSTTLASPLWVPAYAVAQVEPSPNRYRQFDVPVLPGGVLEGRVLMPGGAAAQGGLVLVLSHPASGERRVITTFGDGSFYAMGLRPGDWELAVDPRTLGVLQLAADAVRFHLEPDPDGDSVDGVTISLR
ncbi:MAG TPA: hypothetical protein VFX50_15560, partial [Gemmatimonadales bacterium]|nr:hypothetical protein [Gemmatimonadales bacterium]